METSSEGAPVSTNPAKTLFDRWADGDLDEPEASIGARVRYRDGRNGWRYVYGHLHERGSLQVRVLLDDGRVTGWLPKGWVEEV